jgi:thiol:disulfide interchange protein DsbD
VALTRRIARPTLICGVTVLLLCLSALSSSGQAPADSNVVQIETYASHQQIHPGESFRLAIVVTIKRGFHINSHSPVDKHLIPTEVKFDESKDVTLSPASYPEAEHISSSFSTEKMAVYSGRVSIFSQGRLSEDVSFGDMQISGVLNYQACKDLSCFMPCAVRFEIPLSIVKTSEPTKLVNQQFFELKTSFTSDERYAKHLIEKGLVYAVIAFFLFGLALNLTPCVYPVIPMTVSFFAAQGEQNKSRILVLASYYVIGIAIVFSILGLVSALAGKQWGFLFQDPWFVILISIIILSMAASMFGAFEFTVPSSLMTRFGKSRKGAVGSVIMGLTVGVVIAPCAAGIIIGLVGVVAKLGIVAKGTLLFFVMGLGLGLPYLFLAVFSGLLNRLPRSGTWMVWIRKLFGALLIGVALYFLIPQGKQIHDQQGFYLGVLGIFSGLLFGFLEHGEGYGRTFRIVRGVVGSLLIVVGAFLVNRAIYTQPAVIDWVHYDNQSIAQLQKDNRSTLFDFYADWCIACRKLDSKTFADKMVAEKSRQFTMVRVNCTSPNRQTSVLTERFGVSGLPTIVFLSPKGEELQNLRVAGFVGPDEMLEKLQAAAASQ